MRWEFKFHDFVEIEMGGNRSYLDYHGIGIINPDGIHFVRTKGLMNNRHPFLLQLAVL